MIILIVKLCDLGVKIKNKHMKILLLAQEVGTLCSCWLKAHQHYLMDENLTVGRFGGKYDMLTRVDLPASIRDLKIMGRCSCCAATPRKRQHDFLYDCHKRC